MKFLLLIPISILFLSTAAGQQKASYQYDYRGLKPGMTPSQIGEQVGSPESSKGSLHTYDGFIIHLENDKLNTIQITGDTEYKSPKNIGIGTSAADFKKAFPTYNGTSVHTDFEGGQIYNIGGGKVTKIVLVRSLVRRSKQPRKNSSSAGQRWTHQYRGLVVGQSTAEKVAKTLGRPENVKRINERIVQIKYPDFMLVTDQHILVFLHIYRDKTFQTKTGIRIGDSIDKVQKVIPGLPPKATLAQDGKNGYSYQLRDGKVTTITLRSR